jgi:hypothetical protein
VVEQLTRFLRVGVDALGPLSGANVDSRVEHVGEIVGERGEVACAHVERNRRDARVDQPARVRRIPEAGGAPYLVVGRQGPRDREGDLARRAGDQNLL